MAVADEGAQTERGLLDRAFAILNARMPEGWRVTKTATSPPDADGVMEVMSPDGIRATLVVEVKRLVENRDVASIRNQLESYVGAQAGSVGLVVARYISPPVRERLSDAGLAFLDATGNIHLSLARPGLFLSDHGADRDPWRGPGRPRGTLRGVPAAAMVRVLLDFDSSWRVTELIKTAQVSTGAAYRVIDFLDQEELISRDDSLIRVVDWQRLLRRWSRDYEFVKDNVTTRWIAPRGLDRMLERAASSPAIRYAVTGTLAAAEWAPYAPARAAMIYTVDPSEAVNLWDLRPADSGANVILAEPDGEVPLVRAWTAAEGQYKIAAPAQVAVDLLSGPGRSPSEGEELIGWMARNESFWRLQR